MKCVAPAAIRRPVAHAISAVRRPSFRTSRTSQAGLAPTARRTANSCRRCETA